MGIKRFDGGGCLKAASEEESDSDDDGKDDGFDDVSRASSCVQSSVHLGLGGMGADSSDSDERSIYTETDLGQSKYDMSVRTYEQNYVNRHPSMLGKPSDSNKSSLTNNSKRSNNLRGFNKVWEIE